MALSISLGGGAAGAPASPMRVQNLRCEYRTNPSGLGEAQPRLSWTLSSPRRNETQSAYRILVASSPETLANDEGDLWDSGRVASDRTAQIVYAGAPLASRRRCWWKVRAWDGGGAETPWSEANHWTMGLLNRADWTARWVSAPEPEDGPLAGLSWVWTPGVDARSDAPKGRVGFRKTFTVPDGFPVAEARFSLTADDHFTLFINGREACADDRSRDSWQRPVDTDVTVLLRSGENTLAALVENEVGPAGFLGVLCLRSQAGDELLVPVDGSWKAAPEPPTGWNRPDFDDSGWDQAAAIARIGDAPWHVPERTTAPTPPPCPFLRHAFRVDAPVRRATLHITALGLYEARLNGSKVGDEIFTPGWTDYRKRVYTRSYDVTAMVREGENALGAILADGWACGHVGLGGRDRYGVGRPRLLAQLEIATDDGATLVIGTNAAWKASLGPLREADLLMGETWDARLEMPGWDAPGFDDSAWQAAEEQPDWDAALQPYPGVPVRRMGEIVAIARTEPEPGRYVYDLGQNMVGWVRITAEGPAGAMIRLRFAEVLDPADGRMYVANLRGARNVDTYIKKGDGPETWEPRFTFHGFRYVEVSGAPSAPPLEAVTGVVIHSDAPTVGRFETSNALVNQLQRNIEWGQRGNFLEVPTDCPQRDERLGWLGDAQVFIRTAANNMDVAAFFTKWMVDVEDAQHADGSFPDVAPGVAAGSGTAAWADAGIICPWTLYRVYADTRVLEKHYDAMARFIAYLEQHSRDLLRPAEGYGEWLSIGADTPKDVLGTAYFAWSAQLMSKIARVLGKTGDAERYANLYGRVRAAFQEAYVSPDGRVKGDTQACYVMALKFGLMPDALRPVAARHLADDIRRRGWKLSTGFIGTAHLMPVLSENGLTDVAYRLLLQDGFPGWLFSIRHGATTIWERWDGWTPERGFQDPGMNSFNHYSFGAVGEWLFGTVAGIREDEEHPGFARFTIAPEPGGGLTHARADYDSIRGRITSAWRIEDGHLLLDVAIPTNTSATVILSVARLADVKEGSRPIMEADGTRDARHAEGRAWLTLGSGVYHLSAPWPGDTE